MKTTLWVLLFSLLTFSVAGFDIVRNGKAEAYIVTQKTFSPETAKAVKAFTENIFLATNVRLAVKNSIQKGKEKNCILIVEDKRPGNSQIEAEATFPAKNLMKVSGSKDGLTRILAFILEKYAGIVYVWPTANGLHFQPDTKNITIPEKTLEYKPFFYLERSLSNGVRSYLEPLGLKWMIDCQHQVPRYILPIKQYAAENKWPHENVFPFLNGKRLDMAKEHKKFAPTYQSDFQPCHMSEESIDEAVKNIENYLKKYPDTRSVSLSPNDNRGYCLCEKCASFNKRSGDRKYTRMFGPEFRYKDHSRSYFYWCNKVAERINKKYPHIFFGTLAYRETHIAPDFKLHPRITVFLCFDIGTTQYPDIYKKLVSWIGEWYKTGASLGIWEYGFGDSYFTFPRISFQQQGKIFRLMADHNFRGMFVEGAESLGDGPKRFLYLKLAENPREDVDKLLQNWYSACVGKEAAVYLKKYYDFWEKFWVEKASKPAFAESKDAHYHTMTPFGPYMNGLEKGDLAYLRTQMENVVKEAEKSGTPFQKKRAAYMMQAFEYIESGAIANFSEILTEAGTVKDAAHALQVLQNLPAAEKAMAKRKSLEKQMLNDPALAWWWGLKKLHGKIEFSPSEKALSITAQYVSNPFVREEIKKIVRNKQLPITIRQIANTIVKSEQENNLLLAFDGVREKAKGKQSVTLPVLNGEWILKIPVKEGKYLARVRIIVPKTVVPTQKTWMNLRLQGRTGYNKPAGGFLDTPKIYPQSGKSYTIMNTISLDSKAKYMTFIVNLFHFPDKSKVVLSDMAIIPLE